MISPTCKPVPYICEVEEEESKYDSWSTLSSNDVSGRLGVSEKDSYIRRHAPTKSHDDSNDTSLREDSTKNNTPLLPRAKQIGYTLLSETSSSWSFLHVSIIKTFTIHSLSFFTYVLLLM